MELNTIICGDCLEVMATFPDGCVDAIVTDPPYGLDFMGKAWDKTVPGVPFFEQMLRVLKPGGRLLCFAGTRTLHRMWCNIEDAGFTIEDTIAWIYGSGFPKHKSKLKPSWEPICVARKGKVTPLNIDECRIGTDIIKCTAKPPSASDPDARNFGHGPPDSTGSHKWNGVEEREHEGRWPANLCLDPQAAAILDQQTGDLGTSSGGRIGNAGSPIRNAPQGNFHAGDPGYGDSGGASRFYFIADDDELEGERFRYVPKASRRERDAGLDKFDPQLFGYSGGAAAAAARGEDYDNGDGGINQTKRVRNHHATVKPIALMRWLVRLVTPPGGITLDPFAGSGTTCIAAKLERLQYIGIELDEEYAEIARARVAHWEPPLQQADLFGVEL